MDYNQFIARENRFSRKPMPQFQQLSERSNHRLDNRHRFSEPKARVSIIKINKNKLPGDFFIKKDNFSRKNFPSRFPLDPQLQQTPLTHKKAQSQRLHYSPQKTSFFGFFEDAQQQPKNKTNPNNKLYTRKFQTRNQTKRDSFPIQQSRKLTTATKNCKNQLLDMFPPTHDQQLSQIIISSSKTKNLKLSPRKELISKIREPQNIIDPEKHTIERDNERESRKCQQASKANNISLSQAPQVLNMTFFNAKSTCFPPINRQNQS